MTVYRASGYHAKFGTRRLVQENKVDYQKALSAGISKNWSRFVEEGIVWLFHNPSGENKMFYGQVFTVPDAVGVQHEFDPTQTDKKYHIPSVCAWQDDIINNPAQDGMKQNSFSGLLMHIFAIAAHMDAVRASYSIGTANGVLDTFATKERIYYDYLNTATPTDHSKNPDLVVKVDGVVQDDDAFTLVLNGATGVTNVVFGTPPASGTVEIAYKTNQYKVIEAMAGATDFTNITPEQKYACQDFLRRFILVEGTTPAEMIE